MQAERQQNSGPAIVPAPIEGASGAPSAPCEDASGAPIAAQTIKPADSHGYPAAVADLLRFAELDPDDAGDDWVDIVVMACDIEVARCARRPPPSGL